MKNTKKDRRSERTRRLISAALVELMLEQRYDRITVQDIIDRANIGRSTFYAHYLDKDDLLVTNFTRAIDVLTQHFGKVETDQAARGLTPFFSHVYEQRRLYHALVRGGGIELLMRHGRARLAQRIEEYLIPLIPRGVTPAAPVSLIADHMAGSVMTLLVWWADNDMDYTPEQLNDVFHQLVMPGVSATLHIQ